MTLTVSPFSAASQKPPTNTGSRLHEFVILAVILERSDRITGISLPIPLSSPRPPSSSSRRRGSAIISVGDLLNKSFPRCVSSLESRITSFDCSLGKPTSRSNNKRWLWHTSAFSGKDIYYRSGQLQQAETLVTVSPCEFPPRCHPRILPCHPRDPSCHPRLGRGSPFLSPCHPGLVPGSHEPSLFPGISKSIVCHSRKFFIDYRQTTFSKRIGHEKVFP